MFPTRESWTAMILKYVFADNPGDNSFYQFLIELAKLPEVFECVKFVASEQVGAQVILDTLVQKKLEIPQHKQLTLSSRMACFITNCEKVYGIHNFWQPNPLTYQLKNHLEILYQQVSHWPVSKLKEKLKDILHKTGLNDIPLSVRFFFFFEFCLLCFFGWLAQGFRTNFQKRHFC